MVPKDTNTDLPAGPRNSSMSTHSLVKISLFANKYARHLQDQHEGQQAQPSWREEYVDTLSNLPIFFQRRRFHMLLRLSEPREV